MTIVKLSIGQSIVFKVKGVTVDKAGKWPDYQFADEASDNVYSAPQAAIDRQLERMKLSPIQLPGAWVQLERAPNKDDAAKSWWNLSLSSGHEAATAIPSKRLAPPPRGTTEVPGEAPPAYHREIPPPEDEGGLFVDAGRPPDTGPSIADQKMAAVEAAYARAWATSARTQGPVGTPDSVQAGAATLLIAYQKAGAC